MDTNRMRPITAATNFVAMDWKSPERRTIMVNKITDFLLKNGPASWKQNLPLLLKSIEGFEEKVFASSKAEGEYIAKISEKLKSMAPPRQSVENNILPPNSSIPSETIVMEIIRGKLGRGTFLVLKIFPNPIKAEKEKVEQLKSGKNRFIKRTLCARLHKNNLDPIFLRPKPFAHVQMMKATYYTKIDNLQKLLSRKLEQLKKEPFPHSPKIIADMEKCQHHKRAMDFILVLLNVNKSQIDPSYKQRLDKLEKYIEDVLQKYFSYSQQQCSVDVQSKQQVDPTLQEVNQVCSSQQGNQVSMEKGYGKHVEPQTSGEIKPSEPFGLSTTRTLASPTNEDCRHVNEPTDISDDTSPAMQHFLKVLGSMSHEALVAATDDIALALHLDDDIFAKEQLNRLQANSKRDCYVGSQARYFNGHDPVQTGKKIKRLFDSTPESDSFGQFVGAEKPSSISQEMYTILEEIKEINNILIDTRVVISEGNTITGVLEGAPEHDEGLIVKLLFNSVTVNLTLTEQQATNKKPVIKPLHLFVPRCYPLHPPVILDERPSETEIGVDLDKDDLSIKANLKLRLSLRSMNEPLSLQNIAMSWDRCVREAICEFAQNQGGGTFSSKYGGWEVCSDGF
ncbi:hypothetical protein PIB30_054687 [Stylosanthes scabra]|uniref:Mediator complex subunit 15 KIX domain-containing protein n=1 Tax=Stylosanthes scabra TaxID=79078 RepID=A0ABU6ULU1_9FABA|nr:hypothetical protein [Stylosanthes scabra]